MSERGEYVYGTDGHEGHWLTGEEIVRCRDCKYVGVTLQGLPAERVLVCRAHYHEFPTRANGFCAWGERKVDE